MKCKECTEVICSHRTTDRETECYYTKYADFTSSRQEEHAISKEEWISDTAIKLLSRMPYEYVTSGVGGQTMEPRHIYAARIAKEMANAIFGN